MSLELCIFRMSFQFLIAIFFNIIFIFRILYHNFLILYYYYFSDGSAGPMWALLCISIVLAMHGGGGSDRPAAGASRPAAVAPNAPLSRERFRELVGLVNTTETPTVTYLITLAAGLAIPLINATDAQRRRRQELIVSSGMQFLRLLTDPNPGLPDPNAVVDRQDDAPRLDARLDPSPREVADAARRWGDTDTVATLLSFRSNDEITDNQRSALEELAKAEGYSSLDAVLSQTRSLPKTCFGWMRSLIVRAAHGIQLDPSCDSGDNCPYRNTHRSSLLAFSRREYLAYACAVCRNVFRIRTDDLPAVQPAPAAPEGDEDDDIQPELRSNPRWLTMLTIPTDRPALKKVVSSYPIHEHLQFHKDKALAANTEKERMRQLETLRSWCVDVFPRDAGNGLYNPDCADEDAPQPTPPPPRSLTATQRTPPGSLPGLRGGPAISPAPRQASPSARRGRRERDRSRDRRDRSRDRGPRRNRSREPKARDAASDAAIARLSEPNALAEEARIAQLERAARLARAEAAAHEAQRALERQRSGGTHANRSLDLRADRGRSAMSDTASDASRSAVTPPGIGTARRSEVLGGLSGPSRAHDGPRPPPALGTSAPAPAPAPAANADPPAANTAADDDGGEVRVVSEDPLANKCVLCHDKPRNARVLPCNHDEFCLECILQVFRGESGDRTCPLCRRDIHQVVQNHPPPAPPGPPAAGAPAPPAPPAAGAAPNVDI